MIPLPALQKKIGDFWDRFEKDAIRRDLTEFSLDQTTLLPDEFIKEFTALYSLSLFSRAKISALSALKGLVNNLRDDQNIVLKGLICKLYKSTSTKQQQPSEAEISLLEELISELEIKCLTSDDDQKTVLEAEISLLKGIIDSNAVEIMVKDDVALGKFIMWRLMKTFGELRPYFDYMDYLKVLFTDDTAPSSSLAKVKKVKKGLSEKTKGEIQTAKVFANYKNTKNQLKGCGFKG